MDNYYDILDGRRMDEEYRRSFDRTLRRLRLALRIWLISLLATMIWFSFSC